MLDKEGNFIKLKKRRTKNSPPTRGERSVGEKIGFQDRSPIALAVQKTKNVYGLGNFIDLIKGKITLHGDEANGKAC